MLSQGFGSLSHNTFESDGVKQTLTQYYPGAIVPTGDLAGNEADNHLSTLKKCKKRNRLKGPEGISEVLIRSVKILEDSAPSLMVEDKASQQGDSCGHSHATS